MDKKKLVAAVAPTLVLPIVGALTSAAAASPDDENRNDSIGSWYSDVDDDLIGHWY